MKVKQMLTRLSFSKPVKPLLKPSYYLPLSAKCPTGVKIRTMTYPEVEWSRTEWAEDEGWSTSVGALLATYNQDNEGFYFLELNDEKIASISMIAYPDLNMAFVGYYITREPHRGEGYGRVIMDEVINYNEQKRGIKTFGLNCVPDHTTMFERYGFKHYGEDDFWQLTLEDQDEYDVNYQDKEYADTDSLQDTLFKYDEIVYGAARPNFMQANCMKPETVTIVYESEGAVKGYGVLNKRIPATEEPTPSYRIGPLYADTEGIAGSILKVLIHSIPVTPSTIHLESPKANPSAAKLLTQFGFSNTFTAARMYRGEPPKQDDSKMFCLSSVAFG